MIAKGSRVKLAEMPPWVAQLPDESQGVFRFCLGRIYRVDEVDEHGLFVLDVSHDVDREFGGYLNDIRVEVEYLEEVSHDAFFGRVPPNHAFNRTAIGGAARPPSGRLT